MQRADLLAGGLLGVALLDLAAAAPATGSGRGRRYRAGRASLAGLRIAQVQIVDDDVEAADQVGAQLLLHRGVVGQRLLQRGAVLPAPSGGTWRSAGTRRGRPCRAGRPWRTPAAGGGRRRARSPASACQSALARSEIRCGGSRNGVPSGSCLAGSLQSAQLGLLPSASICADFAYHSRCSRGANWPRSPRGWSAGTLLEVDFLWSVVSGGWLWPGLASAALGAGFSAAGLGFGLRLARPLERALDRLPAALRPVLGALDVALRRRRL